MEPSSLVQDLVFVLCVVDCCVPATTRHHRRREKFGNQANCCDFVVAFWATADCRAIQYWKVFLVSRIVFASDSKSNFVLGRIVTNFDESDLGKIRDKSRHTWATSQVSQSRSRKFVTSQSSSVLQSTCGWLLYISVPRNFFLFTDRVNVRFRFVVRRKTNFIESRRSCERQSPERWRQIVVRVVSNKI